MHRWLVSALALGAISACGGDSPIQPAPARVATVSVTLSAPAVTEGDSLAASAVLKDSLGQALDGRAVSWWSSDPSVATVDSSGEITTLTRGTTSIEATSDGVTGAARLTVNASDFDLSLPWYQGAFLADTTQFVVMVSSKYELASVIASAAGRTAALVDAHTLKCGNCRAGMLDLTGLPVAPIDVTITATDVRGGKRTIVAHLRHDNPPRLSVTAPLSRTVGRPALRAAVSCTDDSGACASLTITTVADPSIAIAQGSSQIDQDIRPAASGVIQIKATDAAGQVTIVSRQVYVEASTRLTELATVPFGRVLDARGSRVLFLQDSLIGDNVQALPVTLWMRDGSQPAESLHTATAIDDASLTPRGAIFRVPAGLSTSIVEVRDGVTTAVMDPALTEPAVADSFAIWNIGQTLFRRDLVSGTTATVATGTINSGNSVAPNGDVAWATTSNDIRWRHNGVDQVVTTDGATALNKRPVTDGAIVAYTKGPFNGTQRLAVWTDGHETIVDSLAAPWIFAADGWVAYTAKNAAGVTHVYTRDPLGVVRAADAFNGTATIDALAPAGVVVLSAAGRRYVAVPPYSTAVDVGVAQGSVIVRDGKILELLGRSVFSISTNP